jgi:hypothetical protein
MWFVQESELQSRAEADARLQVMAAAQAPIADQLFCVF